MVKKKIKRQVTLDSFIDYYMEGNMKRFLRKHRYQYFYQKTYSHTLVKVKESNKKAYKQIMEVGLYPQDLRHILNIFITLDKHFGIGFNMRCFREILVIEEQLMDIIKHYMNKLSARRWKEQSPIPSRLALTAKEALKEQKARGFIHINEFDDYHPKCSHIISNADDSYFYPLNISPYINPIKGESTIIHNPYILTSLIAVEGWTRIRVP